ncbi:MAG: class I adenylate-forming enzyme family protein, partial [Verrucomicrobiota bacterium]
MNLNVSDLIALRAQSYPNHLALLGDNFSISYEDLISCADAIAERIKSLLSANWPSVPTHRVGLFAPNSGDYVIVALGILRAKACFVPIASELAPLERSDQAFRTALHLLVSVGPKCWPENPMGTEQTGNIIWHWSILGALPSFCEQRFAALNPAFIRFSSGTTGESKGVVLGHASLHERIISANKRLKISAADRILWTLPMAHHFAVSIVLYLFEGATVILEDSHLATGILQNAVRNRATLIYG